jgi:tRNA nucleotidyltransferase (CCA-adding enzyme)
MRLRKGVTAEHRGGPPLAISELALSGKDVMEILGTPMGKEVGEGLRRLLEVVLDDPSANTRANLSGHLRDWWRARHIGAEGSGGS